MRTINFGCTIVFLLLCFLLSCSTSRTNTSSQIGLLPLEHYVPLHGALTADTTYKVIQNDAAFHQAFGLAAGETPRNPSFNTQMVVAILFRDGFGRSLLFERAEFNGPVINIHARSCTGGQGCGIPVATIPKVGSAKTVRFFIDGNNTGRVDL